MLRLSDLVRVLSVNRVIGSGIYLEIREPDPRWKDMSHTNPDAYLRREFVIPLPVKLLQFKKDPVTGFYV